VDNGQLVGVVALGDMAVRSVHEDEAGEALSEISENTNKANADGKVEYAGVR